MTLRGRKVHTIQMCLWAPRLMQSLPEWFPFLPSPLPTAISSPQKSHIISLKCKSDHVNSLFKNPPMAFHHALIKIQNSDHEILVILLCPLPVHNLLLLPHYTLANWSPWLFFYVKPIFISEPQPLLLPSF